MKVNGRKTIIQNHSLIAYRVRRMMTAIYRQAGGKMSDEERRRYYDLEEQAKAHEMKAALFGNAFTMIL